MAQPPQQQAHGGGISWAFQHIGQPLQVAGGSYTNWQVKHLRWYLTTQTAGFTPGTRYRYWLTLRALVHALGREAHWLAHLQGPWVRPTGQRGGLQAGRPAKLPR